MATAAPVLMSAENPVGWKLEELLAQLRGEISAKSEKVLGDGRPAALRLLRNNQQILGLLAQAEALQRDSLDHLLLVGSDPGPAGMPRVGAGQRAAPAPSWRESEPPPTEREFPPMRGPHP